MPQEVNVIDCAAADRGRLHFELTGSDRMPAIIYHQTEGQSVVALFGDSISRTSTSIGTIYSAKYRDDGLDQKILSVIVPTIHLGPDLHEIVFGMQMVWTTRRTTDAGIHYVIGPVEVSEYVHLECRGKNFGL